MNQFCRSRSTRFKSRTLFLASVGLVALTLGGCSNAMSQLSDEFGLGRSNGPDEFAVATRAPLSMPPDFSLRPPQPGARSRSGPGHEEHVCRPFLSVL